jgi:hypothetical protein
MPPPSYRTQHHCCIYGSLLVSIKPTNKFNTLGNAWSVDATFRSKVQSSPSICAVLTQRWCLRALVLCKHAQQNIFSRQHWKIQIQFGSAHTTWSFTIATTAYLNTLTSTSKQCTVLLSLKMTTSNSRYQYINTSWTWSINCVHWTRYQNFQTKHVCHHFEV